MKKIVETKRRMGKDFNECLLEMAQANFAAGDFGVTVRDSVKTQSNVRLHITCENVAGVQQPTFHINTNDKDEDMLIGMTGGGQAIGRAKDRFSKYLKLLVEIASLQTQFVTIERVIQVTNRRVNALEFVVIPQIEDVIKWIESELDEMDREDFYRLKCVQDKKKEAKDEEERELAIKTAKEKALKGGDDAKIDPDDDQDVFAAHDEALFKEEEEDDIIF